MCYLVEWSQITPILHFKGNMITGEYCLNMIKRGIHKQNYVRTEFLLNSYLIMMDFRLSYGLMQVPLQIFMAHHPCMRKCGHRLPSYELPCYTYHHNCMKSKPQHPYNHNRICHFGTQLVESGPYVGCGDQSTAVGCLTIDYFKYFSRFTRTI